MESVIGVLLTYCGGRAPADLHARVQRTAEFPFYVLDNGSPDGRGFPTTHYNKSNTGVGGGIRCSINLAKQLGASILVFCTHDITIISSHGPDKLIRPMLEDSSVVQVGASVTSSSEQAWLYPWMANQAVSGVRRVHHCDLLCCALRLSVVSGFGGFPVSWGGYGYDWEIAYHAHHSGQVVMIADDVLIAHAEAPLQTSDHRLRSEREAEQYEVYGRRYGRTASHPDPVTSFAISVGKSERGLYRAGHRGN